MEHEIHEECGVFGIFADGNAPITHTVYYGLFALQHRGQEGCGIAVARDGRMKVHKDLGLVSEVFTPEVMDKLGDGQMAVGHVRYGTTGGGQRENTQPMMVSHFAGSMATVHNGNLVNAAALRQELERRGSIFHTTSDTEVIAAVITRERIDCETPEEAVSRAMDRLEGAYSLILMCEDKLIAVRDPHGFRPLCYGRNRYGDYILASETCALGAVDATFERDILPGEIVVFDRDGVHTDRSHCRTAPEARCIFEYIYFSRPDSVIDGCSVHQARLNAGHFLAEEHPADADVVIGVPDSGIDAAIGYAEATGIPYSVGFIKNKYIGRTFIAPGQSAREDKVRIKLNPIAGAVRGKRVVLIDDSLVRGTTSKRIVGLLREAGATEIHLRIAAPPFTHPCYYGTDVDSQDSLIACHRTVEEVRQIVGADSLGFLNVRYLPRLPGETSGPRGYCTACFTGEYKTSTPTPGNKDVFEKH